jgi:hypothetical protein
MKEKYLVIFILSFIVLSCVNTEEYKKIKNEFRNVTYEQVIINWDSLFCIIPDYAGISENINTIHKTFERDLLLLPENADKYFTSKETAIAIGMYTADLGYVRHFEKVQLCTDFLEAVNTLSNKLAIENKEFNKLIPEIENNLNNKENLFSIIDSIMDIGSSFLSESEQYGLSALFLSGFWIESSYVGFSNIQNDILENHIEVVDNHFNILKQITYILDHFEDDDILDLKNDLLSLDNKYRDGEPVFSNIENIRNKYKK